MGAEAHINCRKFENTRKVENTMSIYRTAANVKAKKVKDGDTFNIPDFGGGCYFGGATKLPWVTEALTGESNCLNTGSYVTVVGISETHGVLCFYDNNYCPGRTTSWSGYFFVPEEILLQWPDLIHDKQSREASRIEAARKILFKKRSQ